MNEDPVYYKKLSFLIRQTIEDYHQQRINETEYLNRAKDFQDQFLNGRRDNVPENLKGNDTGIAIYNLVNEIFKAELEDKKDVASELAEGIDIVIRSIVFDEDKLVIDWQNKSDVEGQIKIAIDDYIFDLKTKYDTDFSFKQIDKLVEEGLDIAKIKFV